MMLSEIITYTELADLNMIAVLESNSIPNAVKLFSHILNAQHIWMKRILDEKPEFDVWYLHQVEDFKSLSKENFNQIKYIYHNFEMDKIISYITFSGAAFQNQVGDVLFHLLNHSTYHRGQIATILKENGINPPGTDYIIMKRDHQL